MCVFVASAEHCQRLVNNTAASHTATVTTAGAAAAGGGVGVDEVRTCFSAASAVSSQSHHSRLTDNDTDHASSVCATVLAVTPGTATDAAAADAVSMLDAGSLFAAAAHDLVDETLYPPPSLAATPQQPPQQQQYRRTLMLQQAAPPPPLHGAGCRQQFVAMVDVLRMSSLGPSLLLASPSTRQTHAVMHWPSSSSTADDRSRTDTSSTERACSGVWSSGGWSGGLEPAVNQQQSLVCSGTAVDPACGATVPVPCCNVNALFTLPATHFLPTAATATAQQTLIGYECVAGQRMIGCEYCDSPMTGVVCLQSPPLAAATH